MAAVNSTLKITSRKDVATLNVVAIGLCVALNMMDGYDILIMAFAAPYIKQEWALTVSETAILLSSGLAGMGLGGITLASLADVVGRRRIILLCQVVAMSGMFAGACSETLAQLCAFRFITGLGVGGMMPAINTAVAEYASPRWRNLAIVIQTAGYPLGGTLGGILGIYLLQSHGWRALLLCGGVLSALLIPAVIRWVPESAEYLRSRRSDASAADKGEARIDARPGSPAHTAAGRYRVGMPVLFSSALRRQTLLMCTATFLVQFTFYFVVNWAPALLGRSPLPSISAISGAMFINCGGILGDLMFGLLCLRSSPRRLGAIAMLFGFACIVSLALLPPGAWLLLAAFLAGCCLFASMASLYVIAPLIFPPLARSTGTGLALSVGRLGATLGPAAGALLMHNTMDATAADSALLSMPLLIASTLLLFFVREAVTTGDLSERASTKRI